MQTATHAPILETPRLVLRGHRASDIEATAALWGDPDVVRYITGRPASREEAWSRVLRYAGHWALLGYGYWLVETKAGRSFVGEVGLADYRRGIAGAPSETPEAGWVLATTAHGQGFATEAAARVLAWADAHLAGRLTFCIMDPVHAASIRVARKLGYGGDLLSTYHDRPTLVLTRHGGDR